MDRDAIAEPRSPDGAPRVPPPGELDVWRIELPAGGGRAAARAALGRILGVCLGVGKPETVSLVVDPGGKPRLASAPERLSFNLSHSGGLALVALAPGDVAIGVDVEALRPRRDLVRLACRWLPQDDATTIAAAPEEARESLFYAAWTRHEAREVLRRGPLRANP